MTLPNASSKPSSSGARISGDDLQHLVVWYWCLRAIVNPDGIESVSVEADAAGNVDDVVVEFADGTRTYMQVKATVSGAQLANVAWLTERRPKSKSADQLPPSLMQRLYNSWRSLGAPAAGLQLITGRLLDGTDAVLALVDRNNTIGTNLRRARTRKLKSSRKMLASHLGCDEAELCDFLAALEIRLGQNEAEWLSRVADVAATARIRSDEGAVLVALGWIRTWVKDTRDPRSPAEIRDAALGLGLGAELERETIVIQGLRDEPGDNAAYTLDWQQHFRGDDASNRRGMIDAADWNGKLTNDLMALRDQLISAGTRRVLVRASLRLPCWFATGAALSGVAGFDLAIEHRDEIWAADQRCAKRRPVVVLSDDHFGAGATIVVVAISTDRTADVAAMLRGSDHGRLVTITVGDGPNQALLSDANDVLSAAIAVREWIRANVTSPAVDLVLMAPAPFAAFLGWCWDRMPDTTIYEDLLDGYEAAFTVTNRSA